MEILEICCCCCIFKLCCPCFSSSQEEPVLPPSSPKNKKDKKNVKEKKLVINPSPPKTDPFPPRPTDQKLTPSKDQDTGLLPSSPAKKKVKKKIKEKEVVIPPSSPTTDPIPIQPTDQKTSPSDDPDTVLPPSSPTNEKNKKKRKEKEVVIPHSLPATATDHIPLQPIDQKSPPLDDQDTVLSPSSPTNKKGKEKIKEKGVVLPPSSLTTDLIPLQPIDQKSTLPDDQDTVLSTPSPTNKKGKEKIKEKEVVIPSSPSPNDSIPLQPIDKKLTPSDDQNIVLPPSSPTNKKDKERIKETEVVIPPSSSTTDPIPLQPIDEKPAPDDQPVDEKFTTFDDQNAVPPPPTFTDLVPPQPVDEKTTPSTDLNIDDLLSKYDAFVSFRGSDVRKGFRSHLFSYMTNQKYLDIFKDDVNLRPGEKITPALTEAIERSLAYVVIFSPNYATSRWCLEELVQILECAKKHKRLMVTVFFGGVTPSNVRHQSGSFEPAFVAHKNNFSQAKVTSWIDALKEAADTSGFDSLVSKNDDELVKAVTQRVLEAIRPNSSPITEGLVGIEPEIEAVEKLLEVDDAQRSRVIGFWGMQGIGKTTLANAIFDKIDQDKFRKRHFIHDLAGRLKKSTTVTDLRNEMFDKLLGKETSSDISPDTKLLQLGRMRAFIIIDDVPSIPILQELLAGREFSKLFGRGSRMILTSTNQSVLKDNEVCQAVYPVQGLDDEKALKLFSLCAFKKDRPPADYKEMCDKVVEYCGGNPLALKILGIMFHSKERRLWGDLVEKLRTVHNAEILDLLKVSYDELNRYEQSVFLDIACFFNYDEYEFVTRVLDEDLVTNLVDKSLLGINNYSKGDKMMIQMHTLLEDLGKYIVGGEKVRSRLWEAKEALKLLVKNRGTEATEGIEMNLNEIEKKIKPVSSDTFANMLNLRLLSIELAPESEVIFPNGEGLLSSLPDKLIYIRWDVFAATSLPSEYSPENLRVLRLKHNSINQLWEGTDVDLKSLEELNLTASKYLTKLPDLKAAKKLELIVLTSCGQLLQLHNSIISLPSLKTLILDSCKALDLSSLDKEDTKGAAAFPSLEEVNLDATSIEEVPNLLLRAPKLTKIDCSACPNLSKFPSIDALVVSMSIKHLIFRNNELLVDLPDDLYKLQSLDTLDLKRCENLESFPKINGDMRRLLELNLSYCPKISKIPNKISHLHNLERLYMSGNGIQVVPSAIMTLRRLTVLKLDDCKKLVKIIPSSLSELPRLETLNLDGCDMLSEKEKMLSDSIKKKTNRDEGGE